MNTRHAVIDSPLGELAAELADGSTAQDVGAAVGRNPLSIIVPCHRVVVEEPAELRAARLF